LTQLCVISKTFSASTYEWQILQQQRRKRKEKGTTEIQIVRHEIDHKLREGL